MKIAGIVILTMSLLVGTVAPAAAQDCDGRVVVNSIVAPLLLPFAVAATITAGLVAVVTTPFAYAYAPNPYRYPYSYAYDSPVVEQLVPAFYAQPNQTPPAQQYWYYCEDPKGYPYVSQCPQGWMQVVPQAPAAR